VKTKSNKSESNKSESNKSESRVELDTSRGARELLTAWKRIGRYENVVFDGAISVSFAR
jgi:hypothetical protein